MPYVLGVSNPLFPVTHNLVSVPLAPWKWLEFFWQKWAFISRLPNPADHLLSRLRWPSWSNPADHLLSHLRWPSCWQLCPLSCLQWVPRLFHPLHPSHPESPTVDYPLCLRPSWPEESFCLFFFNSPWNHSPGRSPLPWPRVPRLPLLQYSSYVRAHFPSSLDWNSLGTGTLF